MNTKINKGNLFLFNEEVIRFSYLQKDMRYSLYNRINSNDGVNYKFDIWQDFCSPIPINEYPELLDYLNYRKLTNNENFDIIYYYKNISDVEIYLVEKELHWYIAFKLLNKEFKIIEKVNFIHEIQQALILN